MTTYKRSRRADAGEPGDPGTHDFGETAHQVWLAGLGALARAQEEGNRLFESLVREGRAAETRAGSDPGGASRDSAGDVFGQARERASDAWHRLEQAFEGRVRASLGRIGVPGREELDALRARVAALEAELGKSRAARSAHAAARPATGARAGTRTAAKTPRKRTARKPPLP